nr:synaptobrevin, longin-like domain protein [Tanacetum cinerariifolium]
SAQSKKHDDKTKREAKGKSPIESFTGFRNLSAKFKDFFDNIINEVNTASTLVHTVGQISPNNTNTFSAAGPSSDVGPSNAAASPTHRKSSFSPIPTTRVHKDHLITEIIADLSLATQTRSMTRVAKNQGFEDPDYPDKVAIPSRKEEGGSYKSFNREALHLDDVEGVECMPNKEIFTELARMGYEKPSTKLTFYKEFFSSQWKFLIHTILQCMSVKRTSWNEFSSSMASAVIFLSSGRKFNFSKYIFDNLVAKGDADKVFGEDVNAADVVTKGVISTADDADVRISMNLLQELMDTCTALTRRVEHLELDKIAQALEITKLKQRVKKPERRNKLKVLKLRKLKRVGSAQRIDTSDDTVMDDEELEPAKLQEVVDVVTTTKIITEVVTAASTTITATDVPIPAATTADAPTLTAAPSRRRKRVVIRDPKETTTTSIIIHSKAKLKDKGKWILVEELKPLKKQAQIEQDEKYARELEAELNRTMDWDEVIDHVKKKNVAGFKMDYFKGMSYDDIRLVFEKYFDSNMAFLQKKKEQIHEEDSRAL